MPESNTRVPVTILTGYLGSGKTTLVNHILTDKSHGKKIAIIENEFGDVGIDDALMAKNAKEQVEEEIVEMMNGCICCTVRQDLVVVLKKFSDRIRAGTLKLDAVLIETTGMADPAPVAQTFFVDDDVQKHFTLDGIVTLIDAKHIEQHLDDPRPEGVENEAVEQVAFADRLVLNKTDLVTAEELTVVEERLRGINSFAPVVKTEYGKVEVKNVLNIGAFDLDRTLEMDPEFLNVDGEHEHDDSVTSLGIDVEGSVDMDAIQEWLSPLLQEKGNDLYRMKGVLSVDGADQKYVYHAVHMIFQSDFTDPWGDEPRGCKLMFIGKNLDPVALKASFNLCLANEENRKRRLDALRFTVGDAVECNVGRNKWAKGKVVKLRYRDESFPPGLFAPYQIQLDKSEGGDLIYAPCDEQDVIRASS